MKKFHMFINASNINIIQKKKQYKILIRFIYKEAIDSIELEKYVELLQEH